MNRDQELAMVIATMTRISPEMATIVVELVRAFDAKTALMREAHEDHQAQINEEGDPHAY